MIWVAMTLAFFGFLHLGELTRNSKFNPNRHLTKDDIAFSQDVETDKPEFMMVYIKESKNDPFRLGHTATVGATGSTLCPVLAMKHYLSQRPPTTGPLFIHA